MAGDRKYSRSGGVLLALAIVAGAVTGVFMHQPSIGVLAGTGVGLLLVALVWLIDRR